MEERGGGTWVTVCLVSQLDSRLVPSTVTLETAPANTTNPRLVTSRDDSGRRWQDREALVKGRSVLNLSLNRDRVVTLVDRAGLQNRVVWVG